MSGHNSRFLYDGCTFDQSLKSSVQPCHYALYAGKYENSSNTHLAFPCATKSAMACRECSANKPANISNDMKSIVQRTDIESELRAITRAGSRCAVNKYLPCDSERNCSRYVAVNPYLCDRHITPTNLRMPTSSGF